MPHRSLEDAQVQVALRAAVPSPRLLGCPDILLLVGWDRLEKLLVLAVQLLLSLIDLAAPAGSRVSSCSHLLRTGGGRLGEGTLLRLGCIGSTRLRLRFAEGERQEPEA